MEQLDIETAGMTKNTLPSNATDKARISILERMIPAVALATAASSGIVGAFLIRRVFVSIRNAETAGLDYFYVGTAQVETAVGIILAASAFSGFVAIVFSVIRIFTKNKKASPPGSLLLIIGILGLLPPALIASALWMSIRAVSVPNSGGIDLVGAAVGTLSLASIGVAIAGFLVFPAYVFVPVKARVGRRYSHVVFLVLLEIAIVMLSAVFFWAAYMSMSLT